MCEKRGLCTRGLQVPLLVVTTLLVGVRPELAGEYETVWQLLLRADHILRSPVLPPRSISVRNEKEPPRVDVNSKISW